VEQLFIKRYSLDMKIKGQLKALLTLTALWPLLLVGIRADEGVETGYNREIEALCAQESQIGSVQYDKIVTRVSNGQVSKITIRRKGNHAIRKGDRPGTNWEAITDYDGGSLQCDWLQHQQGHHIRIMSERVLDHETVGGKACVKIELVAKDFQNGGSTVDTLWIWQAKGLPVKEEYVIHGGTDASIEEPSFSKDGVERLHGEFKNFSFAVIPDSAFDLP
jgi:hypothetical protein